VYFAVCATVSSTNSPAALVIHICSIVLASRVQNIDTNNEYKYEKYFCGQHYKIKVIETENLVTGGWGKSSRETRRPGIVS
jgi:hypothetical protein